MSPSVFEALSMTIVLVTAIVSITGVVRHTLVARQRRRLADVQLQMQNRVLDRLDKPEQLLEVLSSDRGGQWFRIGDDATSGAAGRILGSVQVGFVSLLVGAALFLLRGSFDDREVGQALTLVGAIGAAAGAGFLISALVAFTLGRRWGLLPEASAPASTASEE